MRGWGRAAAVVGLGLGLAACAPAPVRVPVGAVPVGHAVTVADRLRAPDGPVVSAVVVTHAADGFHAFLAWSTQAGAGCTDKTDRTLTIRGGGLVHPCSGTVWGLDGRYVAGPHGPSLVAVPIHVANGSIEIDSGS
jgi:hypothetical protein